MAFTTEGEISIEVKLHRGPLAPSMQAPPIPPSSPFATRKLNRGTTTSLLSRNSKRMINKSANNPARPALMLQKSKSSATLNEGDDSPVLLFIVKDSGKGMEQERSKTLLTFGPSSYDSSRHRGYVHTFNEILSQLLPHTQTGVNRGWGYIFATNSCGVLLMAPF